MPATLAKFLMASSSGTSSITINGISLFVVAACWAVVGDGASKITLQSATIVRAPGRLGFVGLFSTVLLRSAIESGPLPSQNLRFRREHPRHRTCPSTIYRLKTPSSRAAGRADVHCQTETACKPRCCKRNGSNPGIHQQNYENYYLEFVSLSVPQRMFWCGFSTAAV